MPTTAHILLTRFNVRVRAKWSRLNNDPAWLANRFDLFERHCLPSVRAQTASDFRWLVYFDPQTPEPFMSRARALLAGVPQATLVTIEAFDRELWMPPILGAIPADAGRVITTRLDNDDALHREFLERVQAAAGAADAPRFLNLPAGFTLRDGRLYVVRDRSNAFLSLLEDASGAIETVWVKPHTEAADFAPVAQVDAPPAWLQVIHGENVSNRVRGRRVPAARLHGFGLTAGDGPEVPGMSGLSESPFAILVDNLSRYPGRAAREAVAGVLRAARRLTR